MATYKDKQYFERLPNKTDNLIQAVMFYNEDLMIVKLFRKQIYVFVKGGLFSSDEPAARKKEDEARALLDEIGDADKKGLTEAG